jgi:hypothetical protein
MLEQIRWALSKFFSDLAQGLADKVKHPNILYFQPGEVAFHVQHDTPLSSDDISSLITALKDNVSSKINNSKIRDEIRAALDFAENQLLGRVERSQTPTLEPSFHIPADLAEDDQEKYMTTLYVKTKISDDQLLQTATTLNEGIPEAGVNVGSNSKQNFVLLCASLNWHAGSAQGLGGSGGGPGAIPIPLTQAEAKSLLERDVVVDILTLGSIQNLEDDLRKQAKDEPFEAEIVILDTIPPLPQLAAQFQKFVINRKGGEHPLLHSFFGRSSGFDTKLNGDYLTVTPQGVPGNKNIEFRFSYNLMQNDDGRLLMDVLSDHEDGIGLNSFPHKITDHGLFVAGSILNYLEKFNALISDDAKKMKFHIHLVQTLSDYGVGTFESLQHSLNFALNNRVKKDPKSPAAQKGLPVPLVINCSLMLAAPRYGHPFKLVSPVLDHQTKRLIQKIAPLSDKKVKELYEQAEAKRAEAKKPDFDDQLIQIMLRPLNYIISKLDTDDADGVNIIAAAGNENVQNELRPAKADNVIKKFRLITRYPAAFKNVIGVGALKWDWKTYADYSNQADEPEYDGAVAPGGEACLDTALEEPTLMTSGNMGVAGVYLGDFPRLKWRDKNRGIKGVTREQNQSGWASWAGTSFAAPRITALIALVRAQGSTAGEAKKQLRLTAAQIEMLKSKSTASTASTGQETPVCKE